VERKGGRILRSQRTGQRSLKLGNYIIVTDTQETEYNYLIGLRQSLPSDLQNRLSIKVISGISISCLIDKALTERAQKAQFAELWIVFDRDEVMNFDQIISDADKQGIRVGWSNPCIEIWFHTYLGEMPASISSGICCNKFEKAFSRKTGNNYDKADSNIYETLCKIGDEKKAIDIATLRYKQHRENDKCKPSEMNPCTTLHTLVCEIKCKCNQ